MSCNNMKYDILLGLGAVREGRAQHGKIFARNILGNVFYQETNYTGGFDSGKYFTGIITYVRHTITAQKKSNVFDRNLKIGKILYREIAQENIVK